MMKKINIMLLFLFSALAVTDMSGQIASPDANGNLVHVYADESPLLSLIDEDGKNVVAHRQYRNKDGQPFSTNYSYFDGLGRIIEEVRVGASPTGGDLVTLQEYDAAGRIGKAWLPSILPSQNGRFHDVASVQTASTLANGDMEPYSFPVYEEGQLERVSMQYGPGSDWHEKGKSIRTEYLANQTGDSHLNCMKIVFSTDSYSVNGSYSNGTLQVVRTTNEDGEITITFHDRQGRVILSRRVMQYGDNDLDTYYIYDGLGRLRAVFPPKASEQLQQGAVSNAIIENDSYTYDYDGFNRITKKKMPDVEAIRMAYDKADRLILCQDGVQRQKGICTFHAYDAYGRECLMGECKNNIASNGVASNVYVTCTYTGSGPYHGYTLTGINLTSPTILAVNYYDDYSFVNDDELRFVSKSGFGLKHDYPRGLLTGMVSARLGDTIAYDHTVIYYDQYAHEVQRISTNHLGGYDYSYTAFDFTGNVTSRMFVHTAPNQQTVQQKYDYTYDNEGRPLKTMHTMANQSIVLSDKEYDGLGRLSTEKRNGSTKLRTHYGYNVRSWQTFAVNSLFTEMISYNKGNGTATARYGGDASTITTTHSGNGYAASFGTYSFSYDMAGRLQGAQYLQTGGNDTYSTHYAYDSNGNITSLMRRGRTAWGASALMDNLTLSYDGNRLIKATNTVPVINTYSNMHFLDGADEAEEYTYNANGCLTKDKNKGISLVKYNQLNLPSLIRMSRGPSQKIVYNIRGEKLHIREDLHLELPNPLLDSIPLVGPFFPNSSISLTAEVQGSGMTQTTIPSGVPFPTVDYCGSVIYKNKKLQYVMVEGGFVSYSDNIPIYHFYLRDHLSSNCVVASSIGEVEQRNVFYPYGASRADCLSDSAMVQRWKYGSKELDSFESLFCYDYGFRWYDPILCRWTTPDPLREKYYDISAYIYCGGNPINGIDVFGMEPVFNPKGKLLGTTIEGFKGDVYIYGGDENVDFNKLSVKDYEQLDVYSYSQYIGLANSSFAEQISGEAMSNMWTTIINHFEGRAFFNTIFSLSNIKNRKIDFDSSLDANWQTEISNQNDVTITGSGKFVDYEFTVENVASSVISHEWYTHVMERIGFNGNNHSRAYINTILNMPLWKGTTDKYKKFVIGEMFHFLSKERSFRFHLTNTIY